MGNYFYYEKYIIPVGLDNEMLYKFYEYSEYPILMLSLHLIIPVFTLISIVTIKILKLPNKIYLLISLISIFSFIMAYQQYNIYENIKFYNFKHIDDKSEKLFLTRSMDSKIGENGARMYFSETGKIIDYKTKDNTINKYIITQSDINNYVLHLNRTHNFEKYKLIYYSLLFINAIIILILFCDLFIYLKRKHHIRLTCAFTTSPAGSAALPSSPSATSKSTIRYRTCP